MEEVHHFSHEKHPLKLVAWETILDTIKCGDKENVKGVVVCGLCQEPLSNGDSAYACTMCRFFLHKLCSKLPKTINFPSLYQHPLTFFTYTTLSLFGLYYCKVCCQRITKGFGYLSKEGVEPKFYCCSHCFFVEFARMAKVDAIKKEASMKLQHEGHPQHTLTLQLRPASFCCDACKTEEKGLFYLCDSCHFWIHKSCASLARTVNIPHHPKHPLVLVYSLPEKFYNFYYYCKFCEKIIRRDEWLYHCANCRYFAHIKCALFAQHQPCEPRDDPRTSAAGEDGNSLLHFPMSEEFIDPLKLLHSQILTQDDNETTRINHWSHPAHPLILKVEDPRGNNKMPDINSGDPIKVCYACVRPLSFPYYGCKDDECSVFTDLHKYCAHLPRTLQHHLHPHRTLDLVDTWEDAKFFKCNICYCYGNTFAYKCETQCKFFLCVNCAFLPTTIKHESHNHPLTQLIDPELLCKACNKWYTSMIYCCKACEFQLCLQCAMRAPFRLAHRYCKGHEIPLTYPPVEDHPEDFYCDICEEEMDPSFPLYHCHNHKSRSSFHLGCINRKDYYANVWYAGTRTPLYHEHPLTFVRRKKTPKYVCSDCNQDINGYLVLECRSRTCNFNICFRCHMLKR